MTSETARVPPQPRPAPPEDDKFRPSTGALPSSSDRPTTPSLVFCAQAVDCGQCWQGPGQACGDGWDHLARYLRAGRKGLLSASKLQRAVHMSITAGEQQVIRHQDGLKI